MPTGSRTLGLELRGTLAGHVGSVTHVAVCRADAVIASASADGVVLLWDLNRLVLTRALLGTPLPHAVSCLSFVHDRGDIIVAAGPLVLVCDVNGRCLGAVHAGSRVSAVVVPALPEWWNTNVLATGHEDGAVRVWDVQLLDRSAADGGAGGGGGGGCDDELGELGPIVVRTACWQLRLRTTLLEHKASITALCVTRYAAPLVLLLLLLPPPVCSSCCWCCRCWC
jgi:hypothetical protein